MGINESVALGLVVVTGFGGNGWLELTGVVVVGEAVLVDCVGMSGKTGGVNASGIVLYGLCVVVCVEN